MFIGSYDYQTAMCQVGDLFCHQDENRIDSFPRHSRRETIYQTSANIDFATNWYESIPIQILRSKIFIPIIDEQWYSSFWCSWMLLFALVRIR